MNMETYRGQVKSPTDAIILFEACRVGTLPRVQRRLSEKERQMIKSGSVFVWDEREAGMKRWTDGKSWSASRVAGSFLTYREMEGKRGGSAFNSPMTGTGVIHPSDAMDSSNDAPDGYRYKPDGLMKQSFSITTATGQHLHLISYWSRALPNGVQLPTPSNDPSLRHIRPEKGMYPEATVNEAQSMPAITRSPMDISPYTPSNSVPNSYLRHPPPQSPGGYGWSSGPMRSPQAQYSPYAQNYYPPNSQPGPSPLHQHQPAFPPHPHAPPAGLTGFDRAPPPMRGTGIPPPPPGRGRSPPPAPSEPYPQHQAPYSHQPSSAPAYSPQLPSGERAPHDSRRPESAGPPRSSDATSATLNSYGGHRTPNGDSQHASQNGVSPKPSHLRSEDAIGQRPSHMRNFSDRSMTSNTSDPGKTIPSIGSLINKSPTLSNASPHNGSASHSPAMRDGGSPFGFGSKPGHGEPSIKALNPGKGFGEDHRALRKLDKAFAM